MDWNRKAVDDSIKKLNNRLDENKYCLRQLENELKLDDFQIREDFDNLCIRIIDYLEESKENTIKSNKALKNEVKKLGINLNEGGE